MSGLDVVVLPRACPLLRRQLLHPNCARCENPAAAAAAAAAATLSPPRAAAPVARESHPLLTLLLPGRSGLHDARRPALEASSFSRYA